MSISREPIPADRGTGPAKEHKPPCGSGVGDGVAVTTWTIGDGDLSVDSGVFVGTSSGIGVLVGRKVAVGMGGGVVVTVGVAVGMGVFVGGTGVCVGTGVFVGGTGVGVGSGVFVGGMTVGSDVGVGYPIKMISKSALRAPLSNVSRETDLNPFRKNSTG